LQGRGFGTARKNRVPVRFTLKDLPARIKERTPRGSKAWKEASIHLGLILISAVSLLVLLAVFVFLLVNSLPAFENIGVGNLLFGTVWNPASLVQPFYGIMPMFVATLLVSLVASLIAVPIGLGCTIYLAEIASPRVRKVFKPAVEVLAGIPSVVYGFFALVVLSQVLAGIFDPVIKLNMLNGSVILAVMMVPIMVSISEDAINAVPRYLREASYALGLTRWETVRGVVLPAATSGIVAAIVLSIGRAVGETMTVLMAIGSSTALTFDIFRSSQTMTATIAIDWGESVPGSLHYQALFAIGVVLFVMTFIINLVADYITHRMSEVYR